MIDFNGKCLVLVDGVLKEYTDVPVELEDAIEYVGMDCMCGRCGKMFDVWIANRGGDEDKPHVCTHCEYWN